MISFSFIYHKKNFSISFKSDKDHIAKQIISTRRFYEIDLLEYLLNSNIKGKIAIDVGANIGNHSIFLGSFIAKKIISIEANDELISTLESNLKNNNINHQIIAKGLGRQEGFGRLLFPLEENIGAGKIEIGDGHITITTLDDIAPSTGVVLVKIDVEGMELEVLQGGTHLLKTQHPHLVIEAATVGDFERVRSFLSGYGYRAVTKWNATDTFHFAYQPNLFHIAFFKTLKLISKIRNRLNTVK